MLLPLLLLLLAAVPTPSAAAAAAGVDSLLSLHASADPLSTSDPLLSFPADIHLRLASSPAAPAFTSAVLPVPVHLRLAGFPFSSSSPDDVSALISAAVSSSLFHSLSAHHSLAVSHSIVFDSSISTVSQSVFAAVASHLSTSTLSHNFPTALHPVPYTLVDQIIHADYLSTAASGYYIYVLAPGAQAKPYGYSYNNNSKCLGSIWTAGERYLWVDLSAGPVDYGPALSGEGVLAKGDFNPLAALRRGKKAELLADVAALVVSAYRSLIVPPLRVMVFFEPELVVQFIYIGNPGRRESGDKIGLDFGEIERVIKEGKLLFEHQSLRFEHYGLKYSDCSLCSFAISRATRSFTTRFLFENYTLISSEYLDSKVLHQILIDSGEELRGLAGIKRQDEIDVQVLPVYVFDLEYDKLLMLDRHHQSVAFPGMAIAVRTRSSQTPSDYTCNARHVMTQTRNLDRPIVGAILQSMWGVAPTHLSWNPQHNSTLVDYTWSVGQTPFGPFVASPALTFVQKDAARRNALLTGLNYTITGINDILQSLAAHGGERKLLRGSKVVEYTRRWNLLHSKLEKVISTMSQLDYDKALYYLKSSEHDIYAIHGVLYQATQELEASLICFKDPSFPWASSSMACVFLFGLLYVYAKRGKIFKNKRKQF